MLTHKKHKAKKNPEFLCLVVIDNIKKNSLTSLDIWHIQDTHEQNQNKIVRLNFKEKKTETKWKKDCFTLALGLHVF